MTFEIIQNIEVPAAAARSRSKGALGQALEKLEVGAGFYFEANGDVTNQYPKVAPKKFGGKKFKVWLHEENIRQAVDKDGNPLTNKHGEPVYVSKFGVKRMEDSADLSDQEGGQSAEGDE